VSTTVRLECPETIYDNFERKGGQTWTTHYCPGCGHGIVHKYIAEAVADFGMQDQAMFVSPVGCSVFAYYYFDMGNVQSAHGRCPAVATALKRAHPGALVLGYQGDGDLSAIGGNEIMQAANRGENLTIFFVNNGIYGMTGGQLSPTTLLGMKTTTSPEGRRQQNEGSRHNNKARKAIRKAIKNQMDNKGFSLVEILSPCPTSWKLKPVDAVEWMMDKMVETFTLGVYRDGHELDLGHPRTRAEVALDAIPGLLDIPEGGSSATIEGEDAAIEETRIKVAGFGGQGVILLGKLLAQAGMLAGRQVSWIPSYGPEMRGGTANCSITLSDDEIGSPLMEHPTHLVAMNGPSLEKFIDKLVPGGVVFYNASLVETEPTRTDIEKIAVPLAEITERLGMPKVGNMVMLGAMLGHGCGISREAVIAALPGLGKSKQGLLDANLRAIGAGMEVVGLPAGS